MSNSLLSDVWDETRRFLAREMPLLAPVALMTIGFGLLLFMFAALPTQPIQDAKAIDTAALWWLLPSAVFVLIGFLAVSELVVTAGSSVSEALQHAFKALPRGIGLVLILVLGSSILLFVLTILFMAFFGAAAAAQNALALFIVAVIIVGARIALAYALLMQGRTPIAALVESWRLTAPIKWRMALLMIAFQLVSAVLAVIFQISLGSIFLLIGKLIGQQSFGVQLVSTGQALLSALLQMAWLTFCGLLCRRLLQAP